MQSQILRHPPRLRLTASEMGCICRGTGCFSWCVGQLRCSCLWLSCGSRQAKLVHWQNCQTTTSNSRAAAIPNTIKAVIASVLYYTSVKNYTNEKLEETWYGHRLRCAFPVPLILSPRSDSCLSTSVWNFSSNGDNMAILGPRIYIS